MALSSIRPVSECFIKPKCIVEESKKPHYLGSFELLQLSLCHMQTGFMFEKIPSKEDGGMDSFLQRFKESLSSTLVHFYPLAGQFVTEVDEDQHSSLIFIDCNKGPGAKFIHVAVDEMTVKDIVSPTVPSIVQSLFNLGQLPENYDGHDEPLLSVQLTELVDGIFLGVSANHVIVDETSLWNFLSSWSEIFQLNDTKISRTPIYERWFPEGHGPIIKLPYTHPDEFITRYKIDNDGKFMKVVFHLSAESLRSLKEKANADSKVANKISSIQALTALLWRAMARARCSQSDEDSTCLLAANIRSRVCPPLSEDYFGNAVKPILISVKVDDLLGKSLGLVALSVHQGVQGVTDEFLRHEFVKWIKSPFIPRPRKSMPYSILIGGLSRVDLNNLNNFGLGKPIAMRTGSRMYDGKVMLRPGNQGKGSISVEVCLTKETMHAFQQDIEFTSFLSCTSL